MTKSPIATGFENLVLSLGELAPFVEAELRRGWEMEKVMTRVRQKQVAQAQPERRTVDGMGQVVMSVDPTAYHYWGSRLGYDCWKDKGFRRELARDNPEVRVKTVKKPIIQGADISGPKKVRTGLKYTKSYE